jgi:hypothetical protein
VLAGDDLTESKETYTASLAFAGSYRVAVSRVWGRPLGDKATVKVTRHAGTARQSVELFTVKLGESGPLEVTLADGRRRSMATVPPVALRPADAPAAKSGDVINRLRSMADPTLPGSSRGGVQGGTGAAGRTAGASVGNALPLLTPSAELACGSESASVAPGGAEVSARAVVSPDGRSINYTVRPVFRTAGREGEPAVNIPLIPGANP